MRRLTALLAATLITPAFAFAGTTLPTRKAGFWVTTMTMHMPNMPPGYAAQPHVHAMCTDPATDLKMMTQTPPQSQCSPPSISGGGNSYTVTMSCKPTAGDPQPTNISTTLTIISDNQIDMAMNLGNMSMTGVSNWQGPCPAGWVPGDTGMMVNGTMTKLTNVLNTPKPSGG